jgi:hypothetical protein
LDIQLIRLSLSAKSFSHLALFFSHNKSANNIFYHNLSAKKILIALAATRIDSQASQNLPL